MSEEIINEFVERNGTVEDWQGDKEGWLQALGSFTLGWLACKNWQEGKINEAIEYITDWKDKAYPLDLFPEPDLKKAHELLEAGGMSLDIISASNIRFALKRVCEILGAAMKQQ